jgi:hypothetical protein
MKSILTTIFSFIITLTVNAQIYDVLVTESFDNTTNLSTDGTFGNDGNSAGGGFLDAFDVSANFATPSNVTSHLTYETSSVFIAGDVNSYGGTTPSYLEVFDYTVDHDDEVGFVGDFAIPIGSNGLDASSDILTVQYTIDDGETWTTGLTITADGSRSMTFSDGTIAIYNDGYFRTKEFSIGTSIRDSIVKVRVAITSFTSSAESFALDEFRLVKVREIVKSEGFDNTTSLTTSSGASTFDVGFENAVCDANDIYDVSANLTTPSNITNCLDYEVGSVFVLNHRLSTSAADGEELEMLTYTASDNNELSFRGNFAQFGSGTDPDNNIVIQYSTDGGSTYTTGLTLTGNVSGYYDISDGTDRIRYKSFTTKGFTIGDNLNGQTIKIKAIFNGLDNNDDGIAFDEFKLEKSNNAPDAILPVELMSFNAYKSENEVHVKWVTAMELDNDYFEVQRSSDGIDFEVIQIIDGFGTSNEAHEYFTEDLNPIPGNSYYRLRQVDFDGQNETFSPVAVNYQEECIKDLHISQSDNQNTIVFNSSTEKEYTILLSDNLGRIIRHENMKAMKGSNSFILPSLQSGIYHITIAHDDKSSSTSFIK